MNYYLVDSRNAFDKIDISSSDTSKRIIYHYAFSGFQTSDYLFNKPAYSPEVGAEILHFILNWYRTPDGKDLSISNGVSWGNILSCSLLQNTPYLYKEFCHLSQLEDLETLHISSSEHIYLKKLIKNMFGEKVIEYQSSRNSLMDLYIQRSLPLPRSHWSFSPLGFLTNRFKPCHGQTIVFKDSSLDDYYKSRKDCFFINTRDLDRSIYYQYFLNEKESRNKIPKWFYDPNFYEENFIRYCNDNKFKPDFAFLKFLSNFCAEFAQDQTNFYLHWISYYTQIFDKFSPRNAHFPGERADVFLIGAEIAKSMGIDITLIWDGIAFTREIAFMKNSQGKWLFDQYIVFENEGRNVLLSQGIDPSRILVPNQPHPMLYQSERTDEPIYDVIIFSWVSLEYNPYCFQDQMPLLLKELLLNLKTMGLKVAIKMKSSILESFYKEFLSEDDLEGVDILHGPSIEQMKKGSLIITGMSTAIAEAEFLKKKTVIYEPYENGYCDSYMKERWLASGIICRTLEQTLDKVKLARL